MARSELLRMLVEKEGFSSVLVDLHIFAWGKR